ncbi:MAG: type II toxin-antitoxin system PemK/MazF family toxin [Anaerolineae bacterium]
MRRGEIRWYIFAPPDQRRPVLILTRNSAVGLLNSVTVAPITSTMRGIPSEVFVGPAEGLAAECAINFDHLQTVPKANLGALIGALSPDRMLEVERAVAFALGFDSWLFE